MPKKIKIFVFSEIKKGNVQGGKESKNVLVNYLIKKGHDVSEFTDVIQLKKGLAMCCNNNDCGNKDNCNGCNDRNNSSNGCQGLPDIVLHFNISKIIPVYMACKQFKVPLVPILNAYVTCLNTTCITKSTGYGKPCYKCTFPKAVTCALNDCRFKFMERLFNAMTVPYRFFTMKLRLKILNELPLVITFGKTLKKFLSNAGVSTKIEATIGPVKDDFLGINKLSCKFGKNKKKIALIVARTHLNGLHIALQTFSKKNLKDVILFQLGDSPILMKKYSQFKNITFNKSVPHDEMKEIYKKAYVTLFPSIWFEPSGRVWEESVTAGVPVIAFNKRGGASDFLKDEETALLVDYNLDDFSQAIIKLTQNENLRKKMSQNCVKFAKNNLTESAAGPKFEKIILGAVGR